MKPAQTLTKLTLQTAARLHCGLFSDHRPQGRKFQGFGLMIDQPGFRLQAEISETGEHVVLSTSTSPATAAQSTPAQSTGVKSTAATSPAEESLERPIRSALKLLDHSVDFASRIPLKLEVLQTIPRHVGLGSGTQLALAVGQLWNGFHHAQYSVAELSAILQRGKRSCIGTYGFERGGLLIDRGVQSAGELGECRFSTVLPESWRIVLATPLGVQGLAGQTERQAFQKLPAIDEKTLDRLNLLLDQLETSATQYLPFSEILTEFGLLVGETFAPVQGGRFVHAACETIFQSMQRAGVHGIAQSSWGPTMFAVCETAAQAEFVAQALQERPAIQLNIVKPCPHGAQLQQIMGDNPSTATTQIHL